MTSTPAEGAERGRWKAARTLPEVRELTAQWLEGRIAYQPMYGGTPDEETAHIVPELATINRSGLWTDQSQPGEPYDGRWAQRAAVSGFCSEGTAARIRSTLLHTDLVVLTLRPGEPGTRIVCSTNDGAEHTWWGQAEVVEPTWLEVFHRDVVEEALMSWQVSVVDPVWGRNHVLWPALVKAVRRTCDACGQPRDC